MALSVQPRGSSAQEVSTRLVNGMLGIWLFISAFVWPDSHVQATNTWICGVLCVVFAITGLGVPRARYLNTTLAVWLFVSAWMLPAERIMSVWNNVLCAIAIFVVSLVPSDTGSLPGSLNRLARSP
jgi:SPW repeat